MSYRISTGSKMWLFLVLFWCAAAVCDAVALASRDNSRNSRFSAFNSRLGRRKFPIGAATGIARQEIDLPHRFCCQTAPARAKSKKFPVPREKTGIFAATGIGRGVVDEPVR
jgi:hypothetical protein